MPIKLAPVITIDGPSGSGKGTIAQCVAKTLGWHYLDSGALYRAFAWSVIYNKIDLNDHAALQALLKHISIDMRVSKQGEIAEIFYDHQNITEEIRSETCGQMASKCSAIPFVREALLNQQRSMRKPPGLVTDGRDMGTVVFPDATIKFYFQANVHVRAERRYHQLKEKGKHVNLRDIERELQVRDERDANRPVSPTKPAPDAILIDTTQLSADEVLQLVLSHIAPPT